MKKIKLILLLYIPTIAFSNIDSLKTIFNSRSDTTAVLAAYELGKAYVSISLDSSVYFLREGAKLSEELDYTYGKIVSYRSLGSVEVSNGSYQNSLDWLNKGLRLIDSLNLDIGNKVDFLTNLGVAHYKIGLIGKAIEPYIEAVEICRQEGFNERRSRLLNNLGIFYRNLDRYDDALKIYQQSLELRTESKDTMGMANILFNMAAAYSHLKNQEKAIDNLESAEVLYRNINSEIDVLHCQIAKGTAYFELGNPELAYQYFSQVASQNNPSIEKSFNFNLYQGLALTSLEMGKVIDAEKYTDKVEKEILDSGLAEQTLRHLDLKFRIHEKKGEYNKAFKYLLMLHEKKIEINEEEKINFRQEMETKFLTNEKEHEIDILNTKNELTQLKFKTATQRNIGMGIGLVLFGSLLIWLLKLYRTTAKQNEIIRKSNSEKELLLKEIHHRVKNNLQVVSSLLNLQSKYVKDDVALEAINIGKLRVQSMSLLHRNLYQNEDLKSINVKVYLTELTDILSSTYTNPYKNISIETDIADLDLDIDTVMPIGLITNELISNALKYAFIDRNEGNIQLVLKEQENGLLLEVTDDGIGMPFDVIPEKSKSLGLQLVRSFATKLKAQINISNLKGSKISIVIPYLEATKKLSKTG